MIMNSKRWSILAHLIVLVNIIDVKLIVAQEDTNQDSRRIITTKTYKLDWIDTPKRSKLAEVRVVVADVYTGNESRVVGEEFDDLVEGTFDVTKGLEHISDSLDQLKSQAKSRKTKTKHRIFLAKYSRATILIYENLIKLKGRARKTYISDDDNSDPNCLDDLPKGVLNVLLSEKICCPSGSARCHCGMGDHSASIITRVNKCSKHMPSEDFDLEIVQSETDSNRMTERHQVKYVGTDRYVHPDFYNILNKSAEFGDSPVSIMNKTKSAHECAEEAIKLSQHAAIYDVNEMSCAIVHLPRATTRQTITDKINFDNIESETKCDEKALEISGAVAQYEPSTKTCVLKVSNNTSGASFDSDGKLLGQYDIKSSQTNGTEDKDELKKWIDDRKCDLIYESNDSKFICKTFETKPGTVLMLKALYDPSPNL